MHPCQSPSMKSSMKPNSDPPTENPSATPTLANKIPIPLCMYVYLRTYAESNCGISYFFETGMELY